MVYNLINKKHSFVKQATILALSGLICRFIGFLYRVPLTNLIGDEGNGIYASGYYIYTFLSIVSTAGIPAAISKMISERVELKRYEDAHNVFKVSLLVSGAIGLLGSLLIFFGARFLANIVDNPDSFYSLLTLSPTIFIVAIMAVYRGYFQGLKTTVPTAVSQIIEQIVNAISSVWVATIFITYGTKYAAAGGTAGTGIGALAGLFIVILYYYSARKDIKYNISQNPQDKKSLETRKEIAYTIINTAIPIIIGTAVFSITNLIDMKMVISLLNKKLGFEMSHSQQLYGQLTGKYVVLITLPISLSSALATAAIPNLASVWIKKDKIELKSKLNMALRLTMLLSMPATVGVAVLGPQIVKLLYPQSPSGGLLLQVGAAAIVFAGLSQISTGILQGIGKITIPMFSAGCGAIVKIFLNWLLIPISSINIFGAVISTIACYITSGVINFYYLNKFARVKIEYNNIFLKTLFSSLGMGIVCYFTYQLNIYFGVPDRISTVLAIIFSIIIYFVIMFLLRGIPKEDILRLPYGNKIYKILVNTFHVKI